MPDDVRQVRVFVSSPGDARFERSRLERVEERLNGEFQGIARLKTIRWETEFYKAHDTFQAQIPEAAQCDIVVAIFRGRLGTELPADFPPMPDGTPYPSGTAYEVLSAIEISKGRGFPDVYVFRFPRPPTVQLDDPERAAIEAQWERLKAFFERWFQSPQGQFKAAFQTFVSTDDFETQVESLLRKWLEEKVLHGRSVTWPILTKGTPFRGLAAFGAKHAPVFFGRSRDVAKAVDRLKDAAEKGCPFLLVNGASGAGKSSLVRAGLVPRLTAAGVVPSVDVWRVAVTLPGETSDPFAALARELFVGAENLPDQEHGRPPALPELSRSHFERPEELAALLAHADETALKPIIGTLTAIEQVVKEKVGYDRDVRAALLLVIDQLDELFGPETSPSVRTQFAKLLALLARTGRIWIIATLRADLFDRFLDQPELKQLKDDGASYDLAPPDAAALAEIVRGPAAAAGLVFDTDAATGDRLDEQLLKDADRPDLLPLLQFTLNNLFEARETIGNEIRLTFAAYRSLGGIEGAVDKEAERAIHPLNDAERSQLPRLLRKLAAPARDEATSAARVGLDIRSVAWAEAAFDDASAKLVRALVDARVLLSSGEGSQAVVRLAHARVLDSWLRARTIVAENVDFYRIRAEVEEQRRRWEAAKRSRDLLLGRGRPLTEANSILRRFPEELPGPTRDYIRRSGRRVRLFQSLTAAAVAIFVSVAAVAVWTAQQATRARQQAEVSRLRAYSQADLRQGRIDSAIRWAIQAFAGEPAFDTRSTLLAALMQVSPYLVGRLNVGEAFPEAFAWVDNDTLAYTTSRGTLQFLDTSRKRGADRWTARSLASPDRNGERPAIVGLRLSAPDRLTAVLQDGSIVAVPARGADARLMPPQTPVDLNVTAHAAAINAEGSLVVAVPTTEGPRAYICAPAGSAARERCEEKGPLVSWFASAVDISPTGDRIAIAGREGNVEIVSPAGLPAMAPFAAQLSAVSIAWHPQREWLAIGGDNGGLVVLDLVRRAEVFRRPAGRGVVSAVAWRPDGSELAFVCEDMAVCIAHVRPDGTLERESDFVHLNGHGNRITRVAWAPDGRHLATADAGHDIMVWGLDPDRRVTFDLPLSEGARAIALAFSPTGRRLAAARDDGDVSLWDAANLAASETRGATGEARKLRAAAKKPVALVWGPDGSLSLGYEDASVAIWPPDLANQPRLGQLPSAPAQLAFTSDGARLAALSADGRVHLVEVGRIDPRASVALGAPPSGAPARALAAHPGQGVLSVSYEGGQIAVWDLATRKIIGLMPVVDPIAALSLSASPDGHLLAATGGDAFVEVYDLDTRKVRERLEIQAEETGGFVAFSHEGRRLAAIGADDRVYVWQFGKAVAPFVTIDIDSSGSRARMTSGQYAGGLAWLGPNQLAVLTAVGVIRIVNLDVADWQSRAAGLHFESSTPNVRP